MKAFEDRYFWSRDGLRLHYRDYAGPDDRPTVLCIPGLTRNARDFEGVAGALAGSWRVWCLDLRGRGDSGYAKDPLTYTPLVYLQDIEALLAEAGARKLVVIGTSLGGIMAMLMAGTLNQHLAGVLLNDIGPEIDEAGLARIRGYVGKTGPWPTWMHAAWAMRELAADIYPDFTMEDWLRMAKRACYLQPNGRIAVDYDPDIATPFKMPSGAVAMDLWPAFDALAGLPVAVVRGATSDILSAATCAGMRQRRPDLMLTEIPRVGHAPTLDEPASRTAIDALLARVIPG
ncbi:alpha/beta fold hydrolase [Parapedomonas caeni]